MNDPRKTTTIESKVTTGDGFTIVWSETDGVNVLEAVLEKHELSVRGWNGPAVERAKPSIELLTAAIEAMRQYLAGKDKPIEDPVILIPSKATSVFHIWGHVHFRPGKQTGCCKTRQPCEKCGGCTHIQPSGGGFIVQCEDCDWHKLGASA